MFTGIIEDMGTITQLKRSAKGAVIAISANTVTNDMKIGDSISVNGTCLTTVKINNQEFVVDLSPETLERTAFKNIVLGTTVNLERPLQLNDRLGGHLVSGHIDGVGNLIGKKAEGNSIIMEFSVPPAFAKYLIPKGSVAIDGISLTVVEIHGNQFTVAVIPHTLNVTTFGKMKIGDVVNLEFDLVAKYIERFNQFQPSKENLNLDFLKSHGYA